MLPKGYPGSVSADYIEYSLWRAAQGIASQISGVLSTQALLYAIGLGKGTIPTAAAINWVLKDGIGPTRKCCLWSGDPDCCFSSNICFDWGSCRGCSFCCCFDTGCYKKLFLCRFCCA